MTKWDYKFNVVFPSEENTWRKLQDDCNKMGSNGWKLVTVTEVPYTKKTKHPVQCWAFKKIKE